MENNRLSYVSNNKKVYKITTRNNKFSYRITYMLLFIEKAPWVRSYKQCYAEQGLEKELSSC
jgi:hypothetical protein